VASVGLPRDAIVESGGDQTRPRMQRQRVPGWGQWALCRSEHAEVGGPRI